GHPRRGGRALPPSSSLPWPPSARFRRPVVTGGGGPARPPPPRPSRGGLFLAFRCRGGGSGSTGGSPPPPVHPRGEGGAGEGGGEPRTHAAHHREGSGAGVRRSRCFASGAERPGAPGDARPSRARGFSRVRARPAGKSLAPCLTRDGACVGSRSRQAGAV